MCLWKTFTLTKNVKLCYNFKLCSVVNWTVIHCCCCHYKENCAQLCTFSKLFQWFANMWTCAHFHRNITSFLLHTLQKIRCLCTWTLHINNLKADHESSKLVQVLFLAALWVFPTDSCKLVRKMTKLPNEEFFSTRCCIFEKKISDQKNFPTG